MNNKLNWNTKNTIINNDNGQSKSEEITIKKENLMNLMEDFLLQADIQLNSKKTYFKGLKKFIQWAITINENEIVLSKKLLILYKNFLMHSIIKPHTQAIYLVALKQFFVWTESNLIFPNIAKNIKGIKKITKQHHKDPLKKEDVLTLLTIEDSVNVRTLRNNTLVHLLIFTGMRIGETIHIQVGDIEIQQSNKSILWIKGKGRSGKDSFVVLLPESISLINQYLNARRNAGEEITELSYLFIAHKNNKANSINEHKKMNTDSISRIINQRMKLAGIKTKRVSAHSLRHTFGVNAIQAGVSLHELQISMRHSTPTTTQVYLGDIEKQKRKEGLTEEIVFNYVKNEKK
jgi:integrase/recombinase XerD